MAGRLKGRGAHLVAVGTLILAVLILTDVIPWLRGPAPETSTWHWAYALTLTNRIFWPVAGLLLYLGLGWWWVHAGEKRPVQAAGLFGLISALILLQLALVYADEGAVAAPLLNRTLAPNSGGYFYTAGETTDMTALLRGYPEAMPAFVSDHPRTHPPGLVLLNWATIKLFTRLPAVSEWMAGPVIVRRCTDLWLLARPAAVSAALLLWSLLPLLAAASTIWPAYALARRLGEPVAAARTAALFAAAVPALLLFAPAVDQLFPPLVLTVLVGVEAGLNDGSRRAPLLAGLILSLLSFLSLGNGAIGLLLLFYALLRVIWQHQVTWRRLIMTGTLVAAGTSTIWLAYAVYAGVSPLAIIQTALDQHWVLVNANRNYATWVAFNLVDLFVYVGPPALVGLLLLLRFNRAGAGPVARAGTMSRSGGLALALIVFILLLNLSGSLRGEAGRVWLLFMPLLALLGTIGWQTRARSRGVFGLLLAQLLLTLSLGLAWEHIRPQILVPVKPAAAVAVTAPSDDLAADFGVAELRDVQVAPVGDPAGSVTIEYLWRASARTQIPYTVFNHLVDENGQLVAQIDGWSAGGAWPTTCWTPREYIVDRFTLVLPADLPAGVYTLNMGLYDAAANTRLPVADGDAFAAATITIPAAR